MFEIDITFHGVDLFCGYDKIYYKVNVNNVAVMSVTISQRRYLKSGKKTKMIRS